MIRNASAFAVVGAWLAGCTTVPAPETPPVTVHAPAAPAVRQPPTAAIEQTYLEKARTYMRERRWAEALVKWELLVLLDPAQQNYRDEVEALRKRISDTASELLRSAAQARRRGNFNQATVEYLRVLNVDRHNETAAQALREIENERIRRLYLNRAPRTAM